MFHWDLPLEDYDDTVSAAEWAWSCLEELAKAYCQFFCDRGKCSEEAIFFSKEKMETWQEKQKSFHVALSYLPQTLNKIDGCYSCAVVKAFANFPLIMKFSPIPPIITLEVNVTEDGCFICGEIEEHSIPCSRQMCHLYITREYGEPNKELIERIREIALLEMDFDVFPLMPPWELSKIKKPLLEGQNIVKYLYQLSHPDDSIKYDSGPENTNETTGNNGEGINDEKEKPVATELQEIPPTKKLRPNQEDKRKVQALAKELFIQKPDLTMQAISNEKDILECGGKHYRPSTRRNWVKEVAPPDKHRPGRPRKK